MQAVIIAGGKGTRLRSVIGDLPKPMAPVAGKPLLQHQVELARLHGFTDIILLLGYGASHIRGYLGDGSRFGVRIRHVEETQPLGTAGSVLAILDDLDETFLVMYGDTLLNVDLTRFWQAHKSAQPAASLFLHPNDHPNDSDLVELDASGRVRTFHPYPHDPQRDYANLVNAALYVLSRDALAPYAGQTAYRDFGKHLFPHLVAMGTPLLGYRSPEYIKDAGTPERLAKVNADFASGRVARGSLDTPAIAVFTDRDGTLNHDVPYISRPEHLELFPGIGEAIRRLNRADVRVVVITNQPVVARGECTMEGLTAIHNKLETALGAHGAYLDAIYFCPHHPDRGFAGERPELKIACPCRKPATGMIEHAAAELNIDLARSWFIGDSTVDLQTAANAGVRSILIATGLAGKDGKYPCQPTAAASDFAAAIDFLFSNHHLEHS